jgi:hypothetical protein
MTVIVRRIEEQVVRIEGQVVRIEGQLVRIEGQTVRIEEQIVRIEEHYQKYSIYSGALYSALDRHIKASFKKKIVPTMKQKKVFIERDDCLSLKVNDVCECRRYSRELIPLVSSTLVRHDRRFFKTFKEPRINSNESILPGFVAWRAGTTNRI